MPDLSKSPSRGKQKVELTTVGKKINRVDGVEKVAGGPIYAGDMFPVNSVMVKVVRSTVPHANIKRIDISKAETYPEVIAVYTAKDVPGINDVGCLLPDKPLLCSDRVRSVGDPIALVVAEQQVVAEEAAELVQIDYEPLPTNYDAVAALEPNAFKVHEKGNIAKHLKIRKGDVEEAFRKCDVIIDDWYQTPQQECMALEPNVGYAIPEGDGSVTVVASLQNPFYAQGAAAKALGLRQDKVRVVQAQTGGAFGEKGDEIQNELAAMTALVASKTRRPAALLLSREESIMAHSKRHDFKMHYKVGATKDGKLQAVEAQLYADTGPYASLGPYTIFRGIIHTTGPYEVPNVKSDAYCVYTNSPYAGSFRGFGCPQVHFSAESIMDELAEKLSIDPITIRKINMLKPYSRTCTDQPLDASVGLEECIDTAVKKSDFMRKWAEYKKETGRTRKGIGIATFFHGNSLGPEGADACTAYLAIFDDGSVRYRTGITEYGTGAPTGHLMIVAEILGIPVDFIHLERPDTSAVPDGGPTVASRSTVMGGRAAMQAALKVRAALDGMTAQLFNCDPDDVEIRGAVVTCKSDSSKKMTFAELVKKCFENGVGLSTTETYLAPRTFYDEEKGYGSPYLTYTFGAVVAEVEVDMDYGYITVTKVTQAFDCGKAINPLALEGQMEGGCIQGLGYGLMEEVATKEGKILNPNFADYFIPTSLDSGPIETSLIEGYLSPIGPYGAKAMAEPAIDAPAAAVSNAVKHATGVRVKKLPVTPEKVILGVEALKTQSS